MPFDFNIVCLLQETVTKEFPFPSQYSFEVNHRKKNDFPKLYDRSWKFINSCYGYWYYLIPRPEELNPWCGVYELCNNVRVDKCTKRNDFMPTSDIGYMEEFLVQIVSIKDQYKEGFIQVLDYFLEQSPIGMIVFLARYQSEERDMVTGVMARDDFIKMLNAGEIVFNLCYIVSKD